jgi:GT2 family glycosyltransferase
MLTLPPGSARWFEQGPGNAAVKRDLCVQRFLASSAAWIYFSDSDHVVERDVVLRLLAHEVPIVGGIYAGPVRDGSSNDMTVYAGFAERTLDPGMLRPGLQEVDWIGGGSVLVRRPVLEAIAGPWFGKADDGEDLEFCAQAHAAGFPVYVDAGVRVAHLQVIPVTVPT